MDITFEPGSHRVVVCMGGRLTFAEVANAYRAMIDHPEFRPGMQALWRFEGVEGPGLSADELRDVVSIQRETIARRGPARVAVVVERDLDFGIVRVYEALADAVHIDVRGFRDLDEAVRRHDANVE
jgi:hypothetical protein